MKKVDTVINWEKSHNFSQILNHKLFPIFEIIDGNDNNWSIVVENTSIIGEGVTASTIHYLVKEAPHEQLMKGVCFNLFDGKKLIGKGVIK